MSRSCFWEHVNDLAASLERDGNSRNARLRRAVDAYCQMNDDARTEIMHSLRMLLQELPEIARESLSAQRSKRLPTERELETASS